MTPNSIPEPNNIYDKFFNPEKYQKDFNDWLFNPQNEILASSKSNQPQSFSINLSELETLLNELLSINHTDNFKQQDMTSKKIIMPTSTSKYRVVKKTANNKVIYVLEFANPTKLESTLVYNPVPGTHTFDTLEEAQEIIGVFKFNFQETTETVYEE